MGKIHTIIVRGISKDEKNALKRVAKKSRLSVNQVMQAMISTQMSNEIKDYKDGKENKG